MNKILLVLGLALLAGLCSCSWVGTSQQAHQQRAVAGEFEQGEFVVNLCTPMGKETEVDQRCRDGEYLFGSLPKTHCGGPWPAQVIAEHSEDGNEVDQVVIRPLMNQELSQQKNQTLPIHCLSPYVSSISTIKDWLNLETVLPHQAYYLAWGSDLKNRWNVCGIAASAGLALVVPWHQSCRTNSLQVVGVQGLRFISQGALGFYDGGRVKLSDPTIPKDCQEGVIREIHQVFLSGLQSRFEFNVKCLGKGPSRGQSYWVLAQMLQDS